MSEKNGHWPNKKKSNAAIPVCLQMIFAFGSCNRQDKPQDYWDKISSLAPEWFIWVGDVIYAEGSDVISLEKGLKKELGNPHYQKLLTHTKIDGVWDDHDYGINDAGKYAPDRDLRQEKYVDFLVNSGSKDLSYLYKQKGLYHSREINFSDEVKGKIIFLDTRSFRDNHFVRSLGEFNFPLSAIIAAAFRSSYSIMGFGRDYDGDVLGESQWAWLEQELIESASHSGPDVVIVVSSIQILTTNPVVESWGHFPQSKRKLLNLFAKYAPKNLLFLSGDVHMGEVSFATIQDQYGKTEKWLEITSSGLTHTCMKSRLQKYLCPLMTQMFSDHRIGSEAYTHDLNFGTIAVNYNAQNQLMANITIYSLESNMVHPVLTLGLPLMKESNFLNSTLTVNYPDFPVLEQKYQFAIYSVLLLILVSLFSCVNPCRSLKSKTKTK